MKNILNYYYHIILDDSDIKNGYFTYNNYHFYFGEFKRNVNEINALIWVNNYMLNNHFLINRIVYNVNNEALTPYNGKEYVLICLIVNNKISFKPVKAFLTDKTNILNRSNWDYLWSIKIDYLEFQIKHLENSYPILHSSINYYIGLTENAISYYKMLNIKNKDLYFSHRRINKNSFYNPLEIIIDYKVRDICEYLKYLFFKDNKNINEIMNIIYQLNLSNFDKILFYIRMIYPSYYFDIYEEIVNNNLSEDSINLITNKVGIYERLLYEIYHYFSKSISFIGVDWINRKFR